MKSKKTMLIFLGCIIIILIGSYFMIRKIQIDKANQKLLEEIQNHYNEMVQVEKGKLYCFIEEKMEPCGEILYPVTVLLEPQTIETTSQQYFKIKDVEYYIFYQDGNPIEEELEFSLPYIVFNQNVHTNEMTELYREGHLILTLNQEMDFVIYYQDQENYYVEYLEQIFGIPKNKNISVYESVNTTEVEESQIPVLYYDNIKEYIETTKGQEQVQMLKEGNYYTISLEDYEKWMNGYIRVPDKAILLLSNEETVIDTFTSYNQKDTTLSFNLNNRVSTVSKPYMYQVFQNTTKENFQKMLEGKTIVYYTYSEQSVPVLNYHFFYNPEGGEVCNEGICLSVQKFESHLQYLKNNGYYTLTMKEFRDWMYGEIEIPEKSVLITIDDGAMGTGAHNGNKLIPLLEKYDLHATLFLITGWWSIENYRSPNLDIESHTYDMHMGNICANQPRGSQLLCSSKEQVLEDLKKSIQITQSTKAFCFPLYAYNDTVIAQVQQAGFELAFVGGSYDATRKSNKYKIPRYPIYSNITMDQFIQMVS